MELNPVKRSLLLLLTFVALSGTALVVKAAELPVGESPAGALPAGELTANETLAAGLRATEIAFAKTVADRDPAAFATFLAEETVFFSGDKALRGKQAVTKAWSPFFKAATAPFSWRPDVAVVLDTGSLGLTSGPVFDPEGNRIGTFNSVWRQDSDGQWKIVFDRGCPDCQCP